MALLRNENLSSFPHSPVLTVKPFFTIKRKKPHCFWCWVFSTAIVLRVRPSKPCYGFYPVSYLLFNKNRNAGKKAMEVRSRATLHVCTIPIQPKAGYITFVSGDVSDLTSMTKSGGFLSWSSCQHMLPSALVGSCFPSALLYQLWALLF